MIDDVISGMDMDFLLSSSYKISLDRFFELWKEGKAEALDVRLKEEVKLSSLGFGINIPLHELPENLNRIPEDRTVAIVCHGKVRAAIAYTYLLSKGFKNVTILDATSGEVSSWITPKTIKSLKENV